MKLTGGIGIGLAGLYLLFVLLILAPEIFSGILIVLIILGLLVGFLYITIYLWRHRVPKSKPIEPVIRETSQFSKRQTLYSESDKGPPEQPIVPLGTFIGLILLGMWLWIALFVITLWIWATHRKYTRVYVAATIVSLFLNIMLRATFKLI